MKWRSRLFVSPYFYIYNTFDHTLFSSFSIHAFYRQVRVAKDIAIQLSDILEQKDFVGVVNAPNIDFARKSQLLPFLQLAEKIGSLQAQLIGSGKIKRINVTMQGKDVAVSEMSDSIKIAVLKGTLSHLLDQDVNFLNAGPLANDMGLSVNSVLVERQELEFANTIKVEYELDGILNFSRSITGTVFGGNQLRIIEMDGFKTDIPPSGSVVFFNNLDKPGALKPIANILAKGGCNIAHFSLGRQTKAGKALGAITLVSSKGNKEDKRIAPSAFYFSSIVFIIDLNTSFVLMPFTSSITSTGRSRPSWCPR